MSGLVTNVTNSTNIATGVRGESQGAASGTGVYGTSNGPEGRGVVGNVSSSTGAVMAMLGQTLSPNGFGVVGKSTANTAGSGAAILAQTAGGDLFRGEWNGTPMFTVDKNGYVSAGSLTAVTSLTSGGPHFSRSAPSAELLPTSQTLAVGDVAEWDPIAAGVVKTTTAKSAVAIGVVTLKPGGTTSDEVAVAMSGVVQVHVVDETGAIAPGDLLVSSGTAGAAMRCDQADGCPGAVIGKALDALSGSAGTIPMLIAIA